MPHSQRLETLNVHAERSRLTPAQQARWQGLPLDWLDASTEVRQQDLAVCRPMLALLDTGTASACFDFGSGPVRHQLAAGAMGLFDGRHACKLSQWACQDVRRIVVDLDAARGDEPDLLQGLRQTLEFHDDELAGVLRAMAREVAEGSPHGALYAQTLSACVLLRVAHLHDGLRAERGSLTAMQLRRVDELIAATPGGAPTLAAMAEATGYSRAQFVRLFRRATGTSPHRYALQARLRRAHDMIVGGHQPLAVVALDTGFASQSHLSSAYVREYGCTPGQSRRQQAR